ncbi:MAG TPA: zinc-binding dehydrogenase [Acidimicrobiales bacterium]|nr:zinc-binding dehydrogenase [Acidimicrobiales bacterium]
MKAAVYYETGGPDVFRYEDVANPELRSSGVIIDVEAIGVQGGDLLHRLSGEMPTRPHVVGYQAAGVVQAVGEKVTSVAPGDTVVATMGAGSYAELVSVPERALWKVPDGMDAAVAACIPIEFATADDCLFEFGHLRSGETVLVHAGAGGVGLAAIQLANAAGATVIATASSDDRLRRLTEFGMDHGINYATGDVVAEVLQVTDRKGVNLVVDPVGGRTLEASIAALAYRGRISWVGRAGRDDRPPDIWPIMQRNASITGVFLGAEMVVNQERTHALVARLIDRVASGELRVVIDRSFPLADAADAHRYIESRQAFGRVILVP